MSETHNTPKKEKLEKGGEWGQKDGTEERMRVKSDKTRERLEKKEGGMTGGG